MRYYFIIFVLFCLSHYRVNCKSGGARGGTGGGEIFGSIGGRENSNLGKGSFDSSTSNGKLIAAALASGYLGGYQGSKISRKISRESSSMYIQTYHRTYYYGNRYYSMSNSDITCRYAVDSEDDLFNLTYEEDGTTVTEIVYNCQSNEYCCDGLDCCFGSLQTWAIMLLIVSVVVFPLALGCCLCCLLKYCRNNKEPDDQQENSIATIQHCHFNAEHASSGQHIQSISNGQVGDRNVGTWPDTPPPYSAQQNQFSAYYNDVDSDANDFLPTYAQLGFQVPRTNVGEATDNSLQTAPPHDLKADITQRVEL